MKERDAEDEAQAKLVIVLPRRPSNPLELQIQVTNHGTRAIVDLTFVGLVVDGRARVVEFSGSEAIVGQPPAAVVVVEHHYPGGRHRRPPPPMRRFALARPREQIPGAHVDRPSGTQCGHPVV
jgi:hypothetical protein